MNLNILLLHAKSVTGTQGFPPARVTDIFATNMIKINRKRRNIKRQTCDGANWRYKASTGAIFKDWLV